MGGRGEAVWADMAIVRRFSLMRRSLAQLPSGAGKTCDAEVVFLGRSEEDIGLMARLRNEAFREHFNYSPGTVADLRFDIRNRDERGPVHITVAPVAGEPAGFLSYCIDAKENQHLNEKRGRLWDIGVLGQFRDCGIAKRLIVDARYLQHHGMEGAELNVGGTRTSSSTNGSASPSPVAASRGTGA